MDIIMNNQKTRAEIDLFALENNVKQIRKIIGSKEIIAVVKANAYGHGDNIICPALKKAGVNFFAVSCIDEALRVKKFVQGSEILIFGFLDPESLKAAADNGFILSVGDIEYARMLSSANLNLRVHIKLNTGMNRVGINTEAELDEILKLPSLRCEAVFTHFSCADSLDSDDIAFTRSQQEKLLAFTKDRGLKIHSQNSGGILFHQDFEGDYVRAGLILYGLSPEKLGSSPIELKPVMTFKSAIHQLRTLREGDAVSYGRTYKASEKLLAAVVPVGYADGYSRANSGQGFVAVKNTLCPILGRVCMDQLVIDVSKAPNVKTGDEVLLYSALFRETNIEYIAEKLNTIPYEITCAVSSRVPRIAKC